MLSVIGALITSFVITFSVVPSVIKIAYIKNLFDAPGDRKIHQRKIPSLGGLAIFAGSFFSITFFSNQTEILELQYIISALILMFFVGIKDDIVPLVPYKKFIGQFLSAIIIIHYADIRMTSMFGLFGIYDVPLEFSYILSLVSIIGIINAFNLIDGINGLASMIGILVCTVFCVWFSLVGFGQYAILSASLGGALLAFFWYNKTPSRIFMGDTGSLILGLISAILTVKFIEINRNLSSPYAISSAPAVAFGILIYPLFDTLRVIILRISQKKISISW